MTYLPYEIWSQIILDFADDRPTLSNIRCVDKMLAVIATPLLFCTIITWLSDFELRRLEYLGKHTQISRFITEIVFRPWQLDQVTSRQYLRMVWRFSPAGDLSVPRSLTLGNFAEHAEQWVGLPEGPNEFNRSWTINRAPEQSWRIDDFDDVKTMSWYRNKYLEAYKAQCERVRKGNELKELTRLLSCFPNLSKASIEPGDTRDDARLFARLPKNSLSLQRGPRFVRNPVFLDGNARCVSIVVGALGSARAPLRKLKIDLKKGFGHESWAGFCSILDNARPSVNRKLFKGLSVLEIYGISNHEQIHDEDPNLAISLRRTIKTLIKASTGLTELMLSASSYRSPFYPMFSLPPGRRLDHLQIIELKDVKFTEEKIVRMLEAFSQGLHTCNLHHAMLRTGSWVSVAKHARNMLQLRVADWCELGESTINGIWASSDPNMRSCWAGYPDPAIAGCLSDYLCHRVDFNPMQRAFESGVAFERDWADRHLGGGPQNLLYFCRCAENLD
ncbi:hypothetical protein MMC13_003142 [Lambiella insularis]|nr:hypothetical protein [Lambiella insularis]